MKHTLYKLSMALLAGLLFFAGCAGPLDSKPEPRETQGSLGRVAIQVGSPARTLQPVLTGFTKYEAEFATSIAGASHGKETITTGSSAEVDLVPGAWTITVTAFTGTGEAEKKAAQGSAHVTVTASQTVPAAITLTPYTGTDAESGTFGYSVAYPAGTENGTLVVTQADGMAVTDGTINLLEGANPKTGTLTLPAGQYKMQIRLTAKDGMIAGRTEALHIYPGLDTPAAYTFTAEDFVAFAEMTDVTVSATAAMDDPGTAVDNAEVTITLYNETFVGILTTDDLSGWIANLPEGLSAKPKAGVADGGTEVTLVITGTPTEGSDEALFVTIPADALTGEKALTVQDNPGAKFAITLPAASAAVTAAANLGGQEDGPFNGSITITLTNDSFTALAAETDLAAWFAAALPAGLSAKPQAAVTAGAKTLTIAITGTPIAVVAATLLEITIPGDVLGRETALPAADADNKATITVSVNELPGVYIIGQPKTEIQFAEDYSDFFIVGQGKGYVFKYTKEGVAVGEQYVVTYGEEKKNDILWDTMVFSGNDVHLAGKKTVEDLKYANSGILIYQKNNGPAIEIETPKTASGNGDPFIIVDGDSVHLVAVSNRSDINYWKITNGTPSDRKVIATGASLTLYGAILSGDSLYLGVMENTKAVYYKYPKEAASAEAVSLSDQPSGIIGGMAKSGNFIYLAGRDQVDGGPRPFYWKLNTETNDVKQVSVDTTGTISHIVVSGDTVYLSGSQGSPSVGGYWKISNDTDSTWCPISGATSMTRLALDGTDLYAVRSHATSAAYWKINAETGEVLGSVTTVSSDTGFSSINGITVR